MALREEVESAHRFFIVGAVYRLGKELGHGEDGHVGRPPIGRYMHGVSENHLIDEVLIQPIRCGACKQPVYRR